VARARLERPKKETQIDYRPNSRDADQYEAKSSGVMRRRAWSVFQEGNIGDVGEGGGKFEVVMADMSRPTKSQGARGERLKHSRGQVRSRNKKDAAAANAVRPARAEGEKMNCMGPSQVRI